MRYTLASGQEVQLILDTWEGQPELPVNELHAGGVQGMFLRLNSISGGHHLDDLFLKTWENYKDFIRCPYFVYNPWTTGEENYRWLAAHMPHESPCVMADIEVIYSALTPAAYAAEVKDFINLCRLKWKTGIYTGQWFLPYVATWPTGDYWWAQYPYSMYPGSAQRVTWEQLQGMIRTLAAPPSNSAKCPGRIALWQCSGDRLIISGSTRALDINLFPGTINQLRTWLGLETAGAQPEPERTLEEWVTALVKAAKEHGWSF